MGDFFSIRYIIVAKLHAWLTCNWQPKHVTVLRNGNDFELSIPMQPGKALHATRVQPDATTRSNLKMEDFELVTRLHNIGFSDGKIAKACNISRQFICDVRNGKKKASPELRAKLQELYDAANRRGLFDIYTPSAQTSIVESTPVVAPVPYYDPSAQYIPSTQQRGPISIPRQIQPPVAEQPEQPQPPKRKRPLSSAELLARSEAYRQERMSTTPAPSIQLPMQSAQSKPTKNQLPLEKQAHIAKQQQRNVDRKPITAPRLLPFRVRWRQWIKHGNAYAYAKRHGLPLPVPPSDYYPEEPAMPEIQPSIEIKSPKAPEPKVRETQSAIEKSPELSPFTMGYLDSEYRNNF